MITFTLVAILGALLAIVLVQLSKNKPAAAPAPKPAADLAGLKITEARAGDIVSIPGAGDDLGDLDFTVDSFRQFEGGERRWSEWSGMYRERRAAVRVRAGDDTDAAVLDLRARPTLEDLGLSEDDLAQMDERQNTADSFEYDGKVWLYRVSREVKSGQSGFYYWEFEEQGGKQLLAVRKVEGEPFAAAVWNRIHPGDITVYRSS